MSLRLFLGIALNIVLASTVALANKTCQVNVTADLGTLLMTLDEAQLLLNEQNNLRLNVQPYAASMPMLKWSPALARFAASNFVNSSVCGQLPRLTMLPLSERTNVAGFSRVGENIASYAVGSFSIGSVIQKWSQSRISYIYSPSCNDPNAVCGVCQVSSGCGTYLQMIWADTTDVGCAQQTCNTEAVVACAYGPIGNIAGKVPYQQGTKAAGCQLSPAATNDPSPSDDGGDFTGRKGVTTGAAIGGSVFLAIGGLWYFSMYCCEDGSCCDRGSEDKTGTKGEQMTEGNVQHDDSVRCAYTAMDTQEA